MSTVQLPIQSNICLTPAAANAVISASDSGKIFLLEQTAAYILTLPAAQEGLTYKFILIATGANVIRIAMPAAALLIFGSAVMGPIAGATIHVGAGTNTVQFSTTCVVGDVINLVCDGTNWYAQGQSGSNAAATGILFA